MADDPRPPDTERPRMEWYGFPPAQAHVWMWPMTAHNPRPTDAVKELMRSLRQCGIERERMAAALRKLEQWDMLHLTPEGRGAVAAEAPWARALIAEALGDGR